MTIEIRFIILKIGLLWMINIEKIKTNVFKITAIISIYSKNVLFFVLDANFHSPII
jgi:hypothetical protein